MAVWGPGLWQNDEAIALRSTVRPYSRRTPNIRAVARIKGIPLTGDTVDPRDLTCTRHTMFAFAEWLTTLPHPAVLQYPALLWTVHTYIHIPWLGFDMDPSGYVWRPEDSARRRMIERDLGQRVSEYYTHARARAAALAVSPQAEGRLTAATSLVTPPNHLVALSRDTDPSIARAASTTFLRLLSV